MTIVYDLVDPAALTGFARDVPVLSGIEGVLRLLPGVLVDDVEAEVDRVMRTNRAAKFRAFDAETPVGRRDGVSRGRVLLPPISEKLPVGEYERLVLEARGAGGPQLQRRLYDDVATLARGVRCRAALAVGDVLADGVVSIDENGLVLEADFGLAGDHQVAPGTLWSAAWWSDIVDDLRAWRQKVLDDSGVAPEVARTSSRVAAQVARAATDEWGLVSPFGTVTWERISALLVADGLPRFEVVDVFVDVDGASVRWLPDDLVVLGPEDGRQVGYTAYGITAEALELAEAQRLAAADAPGLVAVTMKDADPVRVWTKVSATMLPILEHPERMLVADVL